MKADMQGITSVTFAKAKEIMDSGRPFVFIDVRCEEEYIVEHAAGAVLLELDSINPQTAQAAIQSKNTAVLVYCRTGRRSRQAAEKLKQLGYTKVYDVGGLEGWPYGKESGI